jgi:hypothetical protein
MNVVFVSFEFSSDLFAVADARLRYADYAQKFDEIHFAKSAAGCPGSWVFFFGKRSLANGLKYLRGDSEMINYPNSGALMVDKYTCYRVLQEFERGSSIFWHLVMK